MKQAKSHFQSLTTTFTFEIFDTDADTVTWLNILSVFVFWLEMHISRREIEKREIGDREISREKWGIEKSGKNCKKINLFDLKIRHFYTNFT